MKHFLDILTNYEFFINRGEFMNDIQLPNFEYIDTNIGLKYLNNNKELYLKILKNFLSRYRDLQLDFLDKKI